MLVADRRKRGIQGGKDMAEAAVSGSPAEWEKDLEKLARMAPSALPIPSIEEAMTAPPGSIQGLAEPRATLPEAQYRTLVEQLPAVTFMASFSQGLREVYVSPQIQELMGYTQEEWLRSPKLWLDSLHPDDAERWHADFAPLVFEGKPFRGVYRFFAKDGRIVWVLSDARVVRDAEGAPLFVQGVGFDITEQKQAEQTLDEIVSTIRETFWTLAPELDRILFASPAFRSVWGRPAAEFPKGIPSLLQVVHGSDRARAARAFESAGTRETEVEHRVLDEGDRVRWVRTRTWPARDGGRVIAVSEDVTERKELQMQIEQAREREVAELRAEAREENRVRHLVGSSKAMQALRVEVERFAPSDLAVLVTGETGTGKELVARAFHYASRRASKPLVSVNSAAIDENLVNSELFGHEKGAFTGATERRIGKFEQADGGTLFLDEIGDMPASTQARILRVLEEGCFERVGGRETIRVDVRVVCATNRNLEAMVAEKTFREDLYYRINALSVALPPLREREGDVLELAEHFLVRANRDQKRQARLSDAAKETLRSHAWPGNVRELRNAVDQAVLRCQADTVLPENLPPALRRLARPASPAPAAPAAPVRMPRFNDAVEELERSLVLRALGESQGVKAEAARRLALPVNTLTNKMTEFGIVALQAEPWVQVV
jgi:two-component system response regulator HydG